MGACGGRAALGSVLACGRCWSPLAEEAPPRVASTLAEPWISRVYFVARRLAPTLGLQRAPRRLCSHYVQTHAIFCDTCHVLVGMRVVERQPQPRPLILFSRVYVLKFNC